MTRLVVCDVCHEPIDATRPGAQFAGNDYHDTAACMGAIQQAWAKAEAEVKRPRRQ